MKIAILKERANNESRVAISPDVAKLFIKKGFSIFIEKDAGSLSGFLDREYIEAGAKISSVPLEIVSDADIILKVQPSPLVDQINEVELAKESAIIIGMLSPYSNKQYIQKLADRKLSSIAMELVPRATKAQSMDVLSSQSNLAGYRAVIEASYHFTKAFPMMMTACGTISPAKTLVLGVGVAGLQAIATAKRLGSAVTAYDVRSTTKEQVESLGAKFLSPDYSNNAEEKSGYASEVTNDYKVKQEEFLTSIVKNYDIIITTAQIPGKQAPILITRDMVKSMKHGSVIVDMSTSMGGNVDPSKIDEIIVCEGVKIIGLSNLASKVATDSSKLYARNLYNFLDYATQSGTFNFEDDVVRKMLVTKDGKVIFSNPV
jgi:NAD(P) transhydrogenase subunit alpha